MTTVISDQFKKMTPAQQDFVLSNLLNRVYQNPTAYGLDPDGALKTGSKLDFTQLFKNEKEIQAVFDKARETIRPGSDKERNILANKERITAWVKDNPKERITGDKVNEIINAKPKAVVPKNFVSKPEFPTQPKLQTSPPPDPHLVSSKPDYQLSRKPKLHQPQSQTQPKPDKNQIENEIAEAKQRLATLEGNQTVRTMAGDVSLASEVEKAFRSEIDNIYGGKGMFGLGQKTGLDSKEWQEISKLSATQVVKYCTGDSAQSGLPAQAIEVLANSKKHQSFLKQITGLLEEAQGVVKPFENENVEQFFKRLGGYLLKTHIQKPHQINNGSRNF